MKVSETIFGKGEKPAEGSTQEHLPIQTIHDDIVFLKDGSAALILKTSAVNFDLLSENEQLAIIASFAGMLNSLSFAIQIVVRSKRLDVTDYLNHLKDVEKRQNNALLGEMMKRYRTFVENLTQQNEVLDKQFYVVIPVSYLEIGIIGSVENNLQKAMTLLTPRRDHIIKQLARIGLKADQLDNIALVSLFYDIYNESYQEQDIRAFVDQKIQAENTQSVSANNAQVPAHNAPAPQPTVQTPKTPPPPPLTPPTSFAPPQPQTPAPPPPQRVQVPPVPQYTQQLATNNPQPTFEPFYLQTRTPQKEKEESVSMENLFTDSNKPTRPSVPFVVEELVDEYGAAT